MKKILLIVVYFVPLYAFSQGMNITGASLKPIRRPADGAVTVVKSKAGKDSIQLTEVNLLSSSSSAGTDVSKADKSPVYTYNAGVLSTNFTIPLVRMNFLVNKPTNSTNSMVSTSFFSSVGAGINYSWGEMDRTLDANGGDANVTFYNHYGFQLGFLFASNSGTSSTTMSNGTGSNPSTTSTQPNNIFAVMGSFAIMNLQLGGGYELGSLPAGQRRGFFTLAYAIPIANLVKGGYKVLWYKSADEKDTNSSGDSGGQGSKPINHK